MAWANPPETPTAVITIHRDPEEKEQVEEGERGSKMDNDGIAMMALRAQWCGPFQSASIGEWPFTSSYACETMNKEIKVGLSERGRCREGFSRVSLGGGLRGPR
uniref:Uncharacterized protein n=1 Tax=Cannabis sativa TaxID=3483 RepID=A0A803P6H7_CANSA